ncbi:MAG TPA: hypothetical protein ENH10_07880 [Bacteroidetes bacterium]|nr:hypothetical protein [Bacteroidota bacterium]HEX05056.1 hypothetical protein [Bacteroidota bacterium]
MILMLLVIGAALYMLISGSLPVGDLAFGRPYKGKVVSGHPTLMRISALLIIWIVSPIPTPWGATGVAIAGGLALLLIIVGLFLGR